jgi:two-component system sensor histidine kinase CiaH
VLKKLKRKFIIIVMTLVGVVLAGVLGFSLHASWSAQHELIDHALERNLEGDLNSVPTIGGPQGSDHGEGMLSIAVIVSDDGVILQTSDSPALISTETLRRVIRTAIRSSEDRGVISERHIAWRRAVQSDGSVRISMVDTAAADRSFSNQVVRDGEIMVLAMLAMFFISWKLADWSLKPVADAWDRQRRFISDASHELKTPLSVILANSQILLKDGNLGDESRRWVQSTQDEATHMKNLVNDLLQLAKTDEGAGGSTSAFTKKDVDFSEIVDSCALEFDAVAFDRGVMLDSNVEEGIHLQGDPEWLGRLAKILIDNATKYARKGTEVKVTLKRTSQHIVLSVNNQGDPIDPEDLPHLFDRFYRSDKARSRGEGEQGGFGLGLAIAKGIAEVHGGTIKATSTKADGTTFTVTL